jgi:uncharacterized membrane protein YgaE (UPF0421/DUF939 family)
VIVIERHSSVLLAQNGFPLAHHPTDTRVVVLSEFVHHALEWLGVGGFMTPKWTRIFSGLTRQSLEHLARTTVAAMLSLYLANLFKLPEPYWAAITSLIVMQSTLGDTITVSGQRFAGTALGAAAGALLSRHFGPNPMVFGAGVFMLGGICLLLHLGRAATALASVTLALVVLVARAESGLALAVHRFVEVSLGIVVALVLTFVWPEQKAGTTK